ncbi:MAG: SpoIID/LytB domain-containing protein [Melioribacteraceae bacterium]|nr:SpoIID/LytB domain-containing protein [Melioribacteraceae bacterium]
MKEPGISVCIMHSNEIRFDLYGEYRLAGSKKKFSGKLTASLAEGKILIDDGKVKFGIENGAVFNAGDIDTDSFLLRDVTIGIQFHWQKKENQRFAGSLKFLIEDNQLAAVNIVPIEHYLTSVISSEMSATSSLELLKAHAIISRSWVLAQIEKGKEIRAAERVYESGETSDNEIIKWYDREDHTLYDVCADDHCQRYQGVTRLHAHNAKTAVDLTRGLVLMYNRKICDTRFSKSCGGISESFENVWEPVKHPYLRSIIDYKFEPEDYDLDLRKEENAEKWIMGNPHAFCNTSDQKILKQVLVDYDQNTKDFFRWTVEYTQDEIATMIEKKSGINFGNILDLVPVERGDSGRLIKLKIVGSNKTMTIGKELEIRRFLSESHLYSSAIIIEKKDINNGIPQKFILHGGGWGHGVGLCQIGAAVMGEMGYVFDEILLHYFRGAVIKKYYD